MDLADRPVFNHVKSCPALASTPERLARDLAQARKVARVFEDDNDSLLASNEEAHETHDGSDLIEESRKLKVEELEARRAELGDEAFQAAMDEIVRRSPCPQLSAAWCRTLTMRVFAMYRHAGRWTSTCTTCAACSTRATTATRRATSKRSSCGPARGMCASSTLPAAPAGLLPVRLRTLSLSTAGSS